MGEKMSEKGTRGRKSPGANGAEKRVYFKQSDFPQTIRSKRD